MPIEHRLASKQAVVLAYRMFLGRDPESDLVIDETIGRNLTESELGQKFMSSDEFIARLRNMMTAQVLNPNKVEPLSVDCEIPIEKLSTLLAHVESVWSSLGLSDPHWSVLTNPKYRTEFISSYSDEFYASGVHDFGTFVKACSRNGIELKRSHTCLELGCGVGRITLQLSQIFDRVIGLDISLPHLEIARSEASKKNVKNVQFDIISSLCMLSKVENFDVFFSLIVLQHNPPPVICYILETLLDKLKSGGVGYFQLPVYAIGYRFSADTYLADMNSRTDMEMHVLPQRKLFSIIAAAGCELLEVREDGWVGNANWTSNTILVRKR